VLEGNLTAAISTGANAAAARGPTGRARTARCQARPAEASRGTEALTAAERPARRAPCTSPVRSAARVRSTCRTRSPGPDRSPSRSVSIAAGYAARASCSTARVRSTCRTRPAGSVRSASCCGSTATGYAARATAAAGGRCSTDRLRAACADHATRAGHTQSTPPQALVGRGQRCPPPWPPPKPL